MFSSMSSLLRSSLRDAVGAPVDCEIALESAPAPASGHKAWRTNKLEQQMKEQDLKHFHPHRLTEDARLRGTVSVTTRPGFTIEHDDVTLSLVGELSVTNGIFPVREEFLRKVLLLEERLPPPPTHAAPQPPAAEGTPPTAPLPARPLHHVIEPGCTKSYAFDFGTLRRVAAAVASAAGGTIMEDATAGRAAPAAEASAAAEGAAAAAATEASVADVFCEANEEEDSVAEGAGSPRAMEAAKEVLRSTPLFDTYNGKKLRVRYYIELILARDGLLHTHIQQRKGLSFRVQEPNLDRAKCPSLFAMRGIAQQSHTLWDKPYHVYSTNSRGGGGGGGGDGEEEGGSRYSLMPGAAQVLAVAEAASAAVDAEALQQQEEGKEQEDEEEEEEGEGEKEEEVGASAEAAAAAPEGPKAPATEPAATKAAAAAAAAAPPQNGVITCVTRYTDVRERPLMMHLRIGEHVSARLVIERNVYHCKDIIKGGLTFLGSKMHYTSHFKLVDCSLEFLKRELLVHPTQGHTILSENLLFRSELVDGPPSFKDEVPLSLPLRGIPQLTPSLFEMQGRASVHFFLKLVVTCSFCCDEEQEDAAAAAANGAVVPGASVHTAEMEVVLWRLPDAA